MHEYLFLEPLDVLYLRGNRLFGQAGDHSEALMPPWPSVAAGAIRTRILADHLPGTGVSMEQFSDNVSPGGPLGECLGTPSDPGTFQVTHFSLARMVPGGPEFFLPLPSDIVVQEDNPGVCRYLLPGRLEHGVMSGYPLQGVPILRALTPKKNLRGILLNSVGVEAYLAGEPLGSRHMRKTEDLWLPETRLGIALSALSRTADEGRIYTSMVVAMKEDAGFVVGVVGASGFLPRSGLLRFGGDGRAVAIHPCSLSIPEPPWEALQKTGRFKLVFRTPGLFPNGWRLPGFETRDGQWHWICDGFEARLVAVAIPRSEVISGWDLAKSRPKPALKSVPVGSVYWFEGLRQNVTVLRGLLSEGLQVKDKGPFRQRQTEGFNRVLIGAWSQKAV